MALRYWIIGIGTALFLAGCASISDDACRAGDWESVGFRDGAAGRSPDYILNHAKACNDIGIAPKKSAWQRGYSEGLTRYCVPAVAFDEGREGHRLNNVCPADNLHELRVANQRGLDWYRLDRDIARNERRIREIGHVLAELPNDDPSRASLAGERSILRLETLRLRSRRAVIRYY